LVLDAATSSLLLMTVQTYLRARSPLLSLSLHTNPPHCITSSPLKMTNVTSNILGLMLLVHTPVLPPFFFTHIRRTRLSSALRWLPARPQFHWEPLRISQFSQKLVYPPSQDPLSVSIRSIPGPFAFSD
jgi:hypothetical protein